MIELNIIQKHILKCLIKNNCYLTINQVSKEIGISWNTANKYIKQFNNFGWIERKSNYYKANLE